ENPSVLVSGSVVHVVWQDSRDGNYEIYYKRDPTGNVVGVEAIGSEIPEQFSLEQNYPNPFNPTTAIRYTLVGTAHVELRVYNILGQEVRTLVNEFQQPGSHSVQLDASSLTSGVYFYKLWTGKFGETRKLMLLR
ncbi:MAG: putative carboxypeptidase, partial [Bacteroidetes bacterium]|nr:putative carboxypeptidase [Bacteroidota bacterium]